MNFEHLVQIELSLVDILPREIIRIISNFTIDQNLLLQRHIDIQLDLNNFIMRNSYFIFDSIIDKIEVDTSYIYENIPDFLDKSTVFHFKVNKLPGIDVNISWEYQHFVWEILGLSEPSW